ncbi:hypothetical protein ACEQ8H_002764 [Pleosporales sp. CAS-2024a]
MSAEATMPAPAPVTAALPTAPKPTSTLTAAQSNGTADAYPRPSADADARQTQSLLVPHANDDQTPTGTGLSGATAADAESIGRGSRHSKRSFMAKRRAGSAASSKRRAATLEKTTQPPPTPATAQAEGSTRSKSKRSGGGLLACLPCFTPKDHGEPGDHAPSENAKQAAPAKPSRTSQSTPIKKQDASAAESSNAESSIPLDEKTANGEYLPGVADKPSVADGTVERPSHEIRPQIVTRSSSKRQQAEQTLPPQPGTLQPVPIDIHVTQPTPASTPVQPRPSVEQARIIQDQTEEQKQLDSDIEMKDVPLSTNDVHQEGEDPNADADAEHHKVHLPPPPPLEQRQDVVQKQTSEMSDTSEPQKYLLGPIAPRFKGKKCLVLDLDETLVHSSFKILHQADFTIPVEIEGQYHNVYVIKRPGVDQFMKRVGELYEVVVFTASVSKYGDPLLDQLDIHGVVHHRLFRESCYNHQGNYVKDLSQIGRDLKDTIIIDNSPTSYIFHPQHAVPISSWFSDAHDNELLDLIPVLEDLAGTQVSDVSLVLDVAL